jgi:predicted DNA-binding transcriptional regulator AlpA
VKSLFDPIRDVSQVAGHPTHEAAAAKEVLTVAEAAAFLRLKKTTLDLYRRLRKGPCFIRMSRSRVVYRKADLEQWLDAQAVASLPK